ncbi:MAG TPA: M20/M25/M40 family metallo-hydrolase [Pseudonocardiaceae bacterium]|nr:M20/M25/M40 family metallo-hydrolase [Pseudonocardiaceae bacterium]
MVNRSGAVAALLVLLALGAVTLVTVAPPPAAPAGAPATEFSAGRAAEHVAQIAQRPHPTGTDDNARVRGYIETVAREAGAQVEVQGGEVVRVEEGSPFRSADVRNVVARLPGSDPQLSDGRALLVVAHYDSVPTGPGAADDGAAVAAMLEAMRALRMSGGVRNDVVFLFTDGEELGLLGAAQFASSNDLSRYGAVLNWEARGSRGPVWMFQTGPGNHPLIRAFAAASPRPVANSLTGEVYRRLPNDTDFTVFLEAGATGLNSAFIGGLHDYHSETDTPQRLSQDSLQHHGATMLALLHELGGTDLRTLRGGDAVYFDVLARFVVHYPASWAVPLALVTALALLAAVAMAARRFSLRPFRVLGSAGLAAAAPLIAGAVAVGLWQLVLLLRPDLATLPLSEPYERAAFLAGFTLVALATLLAMAGLLRRWSAGELLAGGLLVPAGLLVLCAFTVPGASYLWQWPLLAGLPAVWLAALGRLEGPLGVVLAALAPAVAVVLFVPLVNNLFVALGISLAAVAVAFAVLGGLTLVPLLAPLPRPLVLGGAALLLAVVMLGVAVADSGFSPAERRPDALVYVRDAVDGTSWWLTGDPEPDEWTTRALGGSPGDISALTYLPEHAGERLLAARAGDVELEPPAVKLLADTTAGEVRTVRFLVQSQRDAWQLQVRLPLEPLRSCTVAGQELSAERLGENAGERGGVVFAHFGSSQGFELSCAVQAGAPLVVEVSDYTVGLPAEVADLVGPRPDSVVPVSYGLGPADTSVVRQIVTL